MDFFSRWDFPDQCRVLCIDTPNFLRSDLRGALCVGNSVNLQDPFGMFQYLMDQIIILYDTSVWRIRDVVRTIEKV